MKKILMVVLVGLFMAACSQTTPDSENSFDQSEATKGVCYDPGVKTFGSDFKNYLNSTGNSDLTGFGGSSSKTGDCAIVNEPVIFVHGNADTAWSGTLPLGGWDTSRNYFKSQGYKPTELYAVNYGTPGITGAAVNYHAPANISKVNRFIKAVYSYTGKKVDIISHSMGVTTVRRAVMGGTYCDYLNVCVSLGSSINSYVDTHVGISGANRGLNSCGVWPLNVWAPGCGPHGLSIGNPFLAGINGGYSSLWGYLGSNWKTGSYTYSIKSYVDELACAPAMPTYCYIWSVHTSAFKGENGSYTTAVGHMLNKENTAAKQLSMVKYHSY